MRDEDSLRREVEHLIHPLVQDHLAAFWEDNACAVAAVAEIPLYFEAGWQQRRKEAAPAAENRAATVLPDNARLAPGGHPLPLRSDQPIVVIVSCPEKSRFARLAERGLSPEAAEALTAWQWSEADKIKAGHLEFRNNAGLQDLHAAAEQLANWLGLLQAYETDLATADCAAAFTA